MRALAGLLLVAWHASCAAYKQFVRLEVMGVGRYAAEPAIFLGETRGKCVMPIPIPRASEMAFELALSPGAPSMFEVLQGSRPIANRDGGLLDELPWQWNPYKLAKRDAFSRLSGYGYPMGRGDRPASPFHLLLDVLRRDACADVSRVEILGVRADGAAIPEDAALDDEESDALIVGSRLLLRRRLPEGGAASLAPREAALRRGGEDVADAADDGLDVPCDSLTDEAIGLAVALGCAVHVEARVWQACRRQPRYGMLRQSLRLFVDEDGGGDEPDARARLTRTIAKAARPAGRLPWEYKTVDELERAPRLAKALSALAAELPLPRAAEASDAALTATIEPYLDESVRRELRARRAVSEGVIDENEAFALRTVLEARERLAAKLEAHVEEEEYRLAAEAQEQLEAETLFLDELLESMPRPAFSQPDGGAFTPPALAAAIAAEAAEDAALEELFESDGDGWYRRVRERERARRAARELSLAFLLQFGGETPFDELMGKLEVELEANAAKEAALKAGRGEGDAEAASEYLWSAASAQRVARQLAFAADATSSVDAQRAVSRLDALALAAERGDVEAASTLDVLVSLTRQLEKLQERSRGGADNQRQLETERRKLAARMLELSRLQSTDE